MKASVILNHLIGRRPAALALLALLVNLASAIGCKHTVEQVPVTSTVTTLKPKSIIYVALPADARYKKKFILTSGVTTGKLLRETFAAHSRRAYLAQHVESASEATASALRNQCTYLIYPTIVRWEDHSTENTGIRDKIELKIDVIDPPTGDVINSSILKASSRWMSEGGDKPQDLLDAAVKQYVASLFQTVQPSR